MSRDDLNFRRHKFLLRVMVVEDLRGLRLECDFSRFIGLGSGRVSL